MPRKTSGRRTSTLRHALVALATTLAVLVGMTTSAFAQDPQAGTPRDPAGVEGQPPGDRAEDKESAEHPHPMTVRLFERSVLEAEHENVAAAIGAFAPADQRVEFLLGAELFGDLPGVMPVERNRLNRDEETLEVPAYIAPLFAQLRALESDIEAIDAELELFNDGPSMGIGIAAFPVQSGYEFVNSWGAARSGGRGHKGTDILAPRGVPILAIESGVIERFSNHSLGGLAIYLRGDSGSLYYYAHLDSFGPQAEGQRVEVGEVIGFNGDTGNARGTPHLHFQWSPSGSQGGWVNPYALLTELSDQRWDPGAATSVE